MADSAFRILANEVNEKLTEILTLEDRPIPEFVFGARKEFKAHHTPCRIAWFHMGGRFAFTTAAPEEGSDTPVTPPLGTRVANAGIRFWHTTDEAAEHLLDRFWMATRQIASGRLFRWSEARYEYETETVGEDLKNGVSVIALTLPVDIAVAGGPDVPGAEVVVIGHDWRAGTELPPGEPEEESEYEVDRTSWTG